MLFWLFQLLMPLRRFAHAQPRTLLVLAAGSLVTAGAVLRAASPIAVPPEKKYVPIKTVKKPGMAHPQPVKTQPTAKPMDDNALFTRDVLPLIQQFCGDCHIKKSKGGISLKDFKSVESLNKDLETWDKVLANVHSGAMPPEGSPQLTEAQKDKLTAWLESTLSKAQCAIPDPGRVTLRRLNRAEYNNTVRDLFGIDFKPAKDFPADDVGYGFDNIGDVLSISPLLMEKYLSAAEQVSEKAIALPPRKTVHYETDGLKGDGGLQDGVRFLSTRGTVYITHKFPQEGEYLLRFGAWAQQAGEEPARMSVKVDDRESKIFDVAATQAEPGIYEEKIKVTAGEHKVSAEFINDFYDEKLPEGQRDRNFVLENIDIVGPLAPVQNAPESHRQIIFKEPAPTATAAEQDAIAREILMKLARRAWRRPVTSEEVDRLMRAVHLARKDNESFERGIQLALQTVLVSPNFLFRVETDEKPNDVKTQRVLNDYELATRLSYFLWSSTPDESLSYYAEKGALKKPENVGYNARRMLKNDRTRALAENFAGQWLQLRLLDLVTPDPKTFPGWKDSLRDTMKAETLKFFETVVREDRSILEFLDADYSFLNEDLAALYGVPDVTGPELRRVAFKGNLARQRGGLLTQASILTLTSNPTRTSPVKRGKWVLEQVFNAPPPPPPPDVPDLPANEVKTHLTLRQKLEEHRKNPACASCHARMDGIGFGLENYNAIGAWREKDGKFALDTTGTLADGAKFNGPVQLKAILKTRKDVFTRSLSEAMLTYALGRGLKRADKCHVDQIVAHVKKNNYKFSALVTAIVVSEPFRKKRGDETK